MPKQVQYTKEVIVNAGIEILRSLGAEALTARAIGNYLGCSVGPLFRTFTGMDELLRNVREKSEDIIRAYVAGSVHYRPAFKEFGIRLIGFSKEEPNLFHFLFLDKGSQTNAADGIARECLKQTASDFDLSAEQVEFIYDQIWPYTFGLAQLCSKDPDKYTEADVSGLLTNQFMALLMLVKSGRRIQNVEPYLTAEGERIRLRRWRDSDAEALFRLASDTELGPRAGWPAHKSVQESLEAIRRFLANDTTWAVVLKETGEIVGCAGYHLSGAGNMPLAADEAEVGYWIGRNHWNQGLCTEALFLVIEHCKATGGFSTLYGEHFIDNPASGRVMEKCGFLDTGIRKTCPELMVGSQKEVRVLERKLTEN